MFKPHVFSCVLVACIAQSGLWVPEFKSGSELQLNVHH